MLEEIAVAEGSLSKKSEFLTKYCNLKQNSSLAFLNAQDVKKCFGNELTFEDFRHSYALGGIDLSQTVDLTAAVIMIMKDGKWYFFTQFFMPGNKIDEATARDGIPYRIYAERGLLTLSGENKVDYHDVSAWFETLRRKYEIVAQKIGYDRYSAQYLVDEMSVMGFQMSDVVQGYNLTGVLNDLEGMVKDGQLLCANDNDLMKIHMMDAALQFESTSNRKRLIKINPKRHIDGMAALSDALCMYHNHWEELQNLLRNAR
jgi:phage terminase large subunit-like protein